MQTGGTFLRFALVGAAVAAIYVGLYLLFLAIGLPRTVSNAAAFLIAVGLQYVGQAGFAFRVPLKDGLQALRFALMIGLGLITSTVITGLIGPALDLPNWIAALAVTVVLPLQNYVIMTRWVFTRGHDRMERPS